MGRIDWRRIDWVESQATEARDYLSQIRRVDLRVDTKWALEQLGFTVAHSALLGEYEAELYTDRNLLLLNKRIYGELKTPKSLRRKRFTEAHELGHVFLRHEGVLHRETAQTIRENYFDGDGEIAAREFEANLFAAALLMPKDSFVSNLDKTISQLSEIYAVSRPAVEMRLSQIRPGAVVTGRALLPSGLVTRLNATFEIERTWPHIADAVYRLQAEIWHRHQFSLPYRIMREMVPRLTALGAQDKPIEKERWPISRGARVFEGTDFPTVGGDFWFIGATDREVAFELILN